MIRGIASTAKLVTPPEASDLASGELVSGCRKPIRTWPCFSFATSSLGRRRDLEHDVGAPGVAADLGAGLLVGVVGVGRGLAGAGLDDDLDLLGGERLDDVGDEGDAPLPLGGLLGDSDLHGRGNLAESARDAEP